ncbi:hypothetical protein PYW08_004855 [Mythimna loreyi]|uniref:Uncharacterized protein n=1 Tax=Mythimna loreyi TaxID=667449 RepID=A0ACC2QFW2_9NEOP|nr:hypothetical protein PYW08_004855 [Mythimna loreyi]
MINGLLKHSSLLLWTLLIATTSSNKHTFMSDASIVSNLLEKIIKPYIDTSQIIVSKPRKRTEDLTLKNLTVIENAIRRNVKQLKPILQDNEINNYTKIETDNNLKLEGNDETTIIEIVPENNKKANRRKTKELTDTFQRKIENYKHLRHNISKLLENVKIDISTKKLITKTLDDMLTLLIERQCNVKYKDTDEVMNKLLKDTRKSMQSIQKVGQKVGPKVGQNNDLANLRAGYWEPFRGLDFHDETKGPRVVFDDIKNFVYQILMNSWNVIDQYRVSCYLRYKDTPSGPHGDPCRGPSCNNYITAQPRAFDKSLDRDSKTKNKSYCDHLLVCTEELNAFLTKTYKSLNETAVDTFRTYAIMYMRDVRSENDIVDDSVVNRELEGLRVSAELKIHKIFMTEMDQFTQDALKTKKDVNIQLIKNFVTSMISQIKSGLYTLVLEKLTEKATIFSKIKDDLLVNLRMGMDSLNDHIVNTICDSFILCNGQTNGSGTRRFIKRNPKKDVYVQLEIALDDKMKDSIANFSRQHMNLIKTFKNTSYYRSLVDTIGRRMYSYVNVTRTTVGSTVTTPSSRQKGKTEKFF